MKGLDVVDDIQAKLDEDLKMDYDDHDDANGKLNWNSMK